MSKIHITDFFDYHTACGLEKKFKSARQRSTWTLLHKKKCSECAECDTTTILTMPTVRVANPTPQDYVLAMQEVSRFRNMEDAIWSK